MGPIKFDQLRHRSEIFVLEVKQVRTRVQRRGSVNFEMHRTIIPKAGENEIADVRHAIADLLLNGIKLLNSANTYILWQGGNSHATLPAIHLQA